MHETITQAIGTAILHPCEEARVTHEDAETTRSSAVIELISEEVVERAAHTTRPLFE